MSQTNVLSKLFVNCTLINNPVRAGFIGCRVKGAVTVPASTELIVSSKATNERKKKHLKKYKQGVPGEDRPGEDNQKSQDRY